MPHYYITKNGWTGNGSAIDPYQLTRTPDIGQIQFMPDVSNPTGWPVVAAYSVPFSDPVYYYVGDDSQVKLGTAVKRALSNLFGVTLDSTKLSTILAELLTVHARTDGTRWKPLRPTQEGFYEIWLGHKVWNLPPVAGGASVSDNFNRADANLDGSTASGGGSWVEFKSTGWTVESNQAKVVSTASDSGARLDSNLASDDHYYEITLTGLDTTANATGVGPIVRKAADTVNTHYSAQALLGVADPRWRLLRGLSGTFVLLGQNSQDPALNDVVRVEADGSSISLLVNTISLVGPITDTNIVDNLQVGIYESSVNTSWFVDDSAGADLAAAVLPQVGSWMSQGYGR